MAKAGRPKKSEGEKARYHRIAVYLDDYLEFKKKLGDTKNSQNRIVEILGAFMSIYQPGDLEDEIKQRRRSKSGSY